MTEVVPKEREEAKVFVDYLRLKGYRFTAIPNENYRNGAFRGAMNKRIGVSPGFPDYIVITPAGLVAVELKRRKGGTVSKHQKEWITALNECGTPATVCRGAAEAIDYIEQHGKPSMADSSCATQEHATKGEKDEQESTF